MINFKRSSYSRDLPAVNLIPLIDVLFVILSFFMAMFLHFNFESSLDISVPSASSSSAESMTPQEVIISISREGTVAVGQKVMDLPELGALLHRMVQLSPRQAVVVRADQKTYHERVVQVLDTCAKANIWNISFATTKEN